jgi:four helix bundle protein
VEGFGRRSTKDFLRYLETASGSLEETKYFLRLSKHLQYLSEEQHLQWKLDCAEAGRLLGGLIQAPRRKLTQV